MTDETGPDYTALQFPEPPPDRPYVVSNMVMSADGKVVVEGTERGLGSSRDQELMRELRARVDMVLNGAATLRASGTSSRVGDDALVARRIAEGRTPNPIASVLSGSGDLPLDRLFFHGEDFEAVVYLTEATTAERRAAIEATGRTVVVLPAADPIPGMLRHMRHEVGARVLLVEGGPSTNGALLAHNAIDEYFLTLGAVLVSGNRPRTAVESEEPPSLDRLAHLELVSATPSRGTNEVFLRYRVKPRGTTTS